MESKKVELLAPAQNLKCAIAAINCGADAVYIGANSFGARKNASNTLKDIKTLIDFAHKFNVKVYITINTILTDAELIEAQKLIYKLYEINADAIIFQDMGILKLDLPPIELHASTQCDIRTLEKVKFFENAGIKRVILARELSIEKIRQIAQNTNIQLECFIHGALCVSYSGQCYLSAYLGGRSANRGECAQPCRKRYSLIDSSNRILIKNKHLLCLKDFCAKDYIDELIDAKVYSFKIEGRLKDEVYVKNTVLYYSNLLKKYRKSSWGEIFADFEPDLNKTFNRSFCTYFLDKKDEISNFNTPKSTGEFIGTVFKIYENAFEIKTSKKLNPQDGLCFFENENLSGFLVNKVENNKIYPNKKLNLKAGYKIFRNYDIKFEQSVKNSKTKRLIGAEIEVFENKITAKCGLNLVQIPLENIQYAKNSNQMKQNFIKSFAKSANSIYYGQKISFKSENIPFFPFSILNKKRNELFASLEDFKYSKNSDFKKPMPVPYNCYPKDYRLNILNKKAMEFYKQCGILTPHPAVESSKKFEQIELMRCKYCIRRAFNICLNNIKTKTNTLYTARLFLLNEDNVKFPLEFDCKNCEMVIKAP